MARSRSLISLIQVARLAGVPQSVTDRAKEIVEELVQADVTGRIKDIEVQGQESSKQKTKHFDEVDLAQMSLFDTVTDCGTPASLAT